MSSIKNFEQYKADLEAAGVSLPHFRNNDTEKPVWIHFGGGNLYRGFHAKIAQDLLDQEALTQGIVVGETFDESVVEDIYHNFNNHLIQVVMHEDGNLEKNLLNSTADSFFVKPGTSNFADFEKIFVSDELQLVTLTITEKGYNIWSSQNTFLPIIEEDIKNGPRMASHTMSIITSLLFTRFLASEKPLALVSTDNFSKNGEKFQQSIVTIASKWLEKEFVPKEFISYLTDSTKISFPWTMIDRITPNPSEIVAEQLRDSGIEDALIIHTEKHTNIASFANTEMVHYLVVEDNFPNGRPPLEKAEVILTDRQTVEKADAMKVTSCLNPLHTALAIFGSLLGYNSIASEMENPDLVALVKGIGYTEGLPVVDDPKIINPKKFIDQVVQQRLPNKMIPDTPQRIATDTSQKMAVRYGETISKYYLNSNLNSCDLVYIPFTIAGWIRYLMSIDDQGQAFTLSPDPLLNELTEKVRPLTFEATYGDVHQHVKPILSNKQIFGLDLYQVGLGEKIEDYLLDMLEGPGAITRALHKLTK